MVASRSQEEAFNLSAVKKKLYRDVMESLA